MGRFGGSRRARRDARRAERRPRDAHEREREARREGLRARNETRAAERKAETVVEDEGDECDEGDEGDEAITFALGVPLHLHARAVTHRTRARASA